MGLAYPALPIPLPYPPYPLPYPTLSTRCMKPSVDGRPLWRAAAVVMSEGCGASPDSEAHAVSAEDLGSYMDVIANLCEQRDAVRPSQRAGVRQCDRLCKTHRRRRR